MKLYVAKRKIKSFEVHKEKGFGQGKGYKPIFTG